MSNITFQLETLSCPSCIKKIEKGLQKQKGVKEAAVRFHTSKVKVDFDETSVTAEELKETIIKLGYPVLSNR